MAVLIKHDLFPDGLWAREEDLIIPYDAFKPGEYGHLPDKNVARGFARLILGGGNILDLGCHCGYTTLSYAMKFPDAQIVGVDIDPMNVELAKRNIEMYDLQSRVTIMEAAVTFEDGPVVYYPNHPTTNSIFYNNNVAPSKTTEGVSIPTIMKRVGWDYVDLMKLDIEGAEWGIFAAPDAHLWAERVFVVHEEVHGEPQEALGYLRALGYTNISLHFDGMHIIAQRECFSG